MGSSMDMVSLSGLADMIFLEPLMTQKRCIELFISSDRGAYPKIKFNY